MIMKNNNALFLISILLGCALLPIATSSVTLATECVIFSIGALGASFLLGKVGLLSLGQAIYFGIASYGAALMLVNTTQNIFVSVLVGVVVALLAGVATGVLVVQRRGVYFIMLTLALAHMFFFIVYSLAEVTGGENGILGVARRPLEAFGVRISVETPIAFYGFCSALLLGVYWLLQRIAASPFGSVLIAIRENEDRAIALGYNTRLYRFLAFVVAAGVTGVAGAVYAPFLGLVSLTNAEVGMSERLLMMAMLGGTGSLFGGILGGTALVLTTHMLSELWSRWMLILGLLLIIVSLKLQGGLWAGVRLIAERFIPGVSRVR